MDCLIIEGGGFRTAFTSGVLDGFLLKKYNPFKYYYGISGGAVALSFYMSQQYRSSVSALSYLVDHNTFTDFKRIFNREGYMNIDVLSRVAQNEFPFNSEVAINNAANKDVRIVVTNRETGLAEYLTPDKENWLEQVTASCTLPFVTKGRHMIDGIEYFDGGWGDALPVKDAYEKGARNILVLRTWPAGKLATQSWADYFGSIYFRNNPILADIFATSFCKYNEAVEFIASPPGDLSITEISPESLLESGTYMYSRSSVLTDYRYGLDLGLQYLSDLKDTIR